jgi:transcriptional regulator with XRE-family HTH domain
MKGVENKLNKLKQIRESKGITISELARLSKVTRATIYRLENGDDYTANSKTLKALADALGVKVTEFF